MEANKNLISHSDFLALRKQAFETVDVSENMDGKQLLAKMWDYIDSKLNNPFFRTGHNETVKFNIDSEEFEYRINSFGLEIAKDNLESNSDFFEKTLVVNVKKNEYGDALLYYSEAADEFIFTYKSFRFDGTPSVNIMLRTKYHCAGDMKEYVKMFAAGKAKYLTMFDGFFFCEKHLNSENKIEFIEKSERTKHLVQATTMDFNKKVFESGCPIALIKVTKQLKDSNEFDTFHSEPLSWLLNMQYESCNVSYKRLVNLMKNKTAFAN